MESLFSNILTASFHGSIVIAVVLVLRVLLKKAPRKFICFLWLLAGLRLLMPFEIQSSLSLQPMPEVAQVQQWQAPAAPDPTPRETFPEPSVQPQEAQLPDVSENPIRVVTTAKPTVERPKPALNWKGLVPYVWLGVAACFGFYTIYAYLSLKYKVREAVKIRGGWECDRIETAFILGFIRPKIYIPMGLSPTVRKHILAHERTHLEKGDHWFKMIGFLALALHWFNPLVWVAYILLCKDIELACDERVVQFMELEERKSYSAALLSCSTSRAHYAACPVAFGEVSVKDRIKTVLNYRRPSFWVSLLGVVAILFVAVCLLTNPVEKAPAAPATVETEPTETTAPLTEEEKEQKILSKEEEMQQRIRDGLDSILNAQESAIQFLASNDNDHSVPWQCSYFKRGDDRMWYIVDDREGYSEVRHLILDGVHYENKNDLWIACDPVDDPIDAYQQWFQWYDTDEVDDFSESTTTTTDGQSYSQIKFYGVRDKDLLTFSFSFNGDGTFTGGSVKGLKTNYGDTLSISRYPAEEGEIQRRFETAAELAMTPEEYENGKIPSNYTAYDRDFMLGSGQMRWNYFNESWQFALGAENATATGLTLVYCESGDGHKSLTADEGFWIEKLVDGKWTMVTPKAEVTNAPATQIHVSWTATERLSVNWEDSYGALGYGFYRLGRYHTVTMPSGESETQHCYAKFRLYNPNQDALLSKCTQALNALKSADSYHLYTFDWMPDHPDMDYYRQEEIWKQGTDHLDINYYPLRSNLSEMQSISGGLWRDGKYYGLEWSGAPATSPVSSWWLSADGYMDGSNLDLWTFGFQWYDAQVEEVVQDGNTIRILETYDFDDRYQYSEISLTFDDSGNLKGMVSSYLPKRNCAQSEKTVREELVVFDTPASDIRDVIQRQDVSKPISFSYAEDQAKYPDAQTSNFKNTSAKTVSNVNDAIALADKECTLPDRNAGVATPYYQMSVYRDVDAGIWKVELFWWQDDDCYQAIYINNQGITQMIVDAK